MLQNNIYSKNKIETFLHLYKRILMLLAIHLLKN